jgi:hypothetical protein
MRKENILRKKSSKTFLEIPASLRINAKLSGVMQIKIRP